MLRRKFIILGKIEADLNILGFDKQVGLLTSNVNIFFLILLTYMIICILYISKIYFSCKNNCVSCNT